VATNFPTALDSLTNPASTDARNAGSGHAAQHANANDAIEAIEAKVGVNNSAVTTSLDYRVAQLEGGGALDLAEGDGIDIIESGGTLTLHSAPTVIRFNFSSAQSIAASAGDWPNSQRRTKIDMTHCTQARIVARTSSPAPASGTFAFQYSTDDSTYAYLDASSGPAVSPTATNTTYVSSWVTLTSGAKADVFVRLVGSGGDGSTSYTMGTIELQLR
jgi:hypothetical protein